MKLELIGAVTGSSVVAWIAQVTVTAQAAPRPTFADAVMAQGYVTWLFFLSLAILGGAVTLSRRRSDGGELKASSQLGMAFLSSIGWGLVVALVLNEFDWFQEHPGFIGLGVFIGAMASEFLTEAVFKVGKDFALNPMQWIRDARRGRLSRVNDTTTAERPREPGS